MTTISASNFSDLVAPHVRYHTEAASHTQIDFFMLGGAGEGHPWGMYRQALRELSGREALLVGLKHSLAELDLDLREARLTLATTLSRQPAMAESDEIAQGRAKLAIAYIEVKIAADEQRVARALREGERILHQAVELEAEVRKLNGFATDHVLTPEDLHRLDEDFWIHSLRQRCAVHHMMQKPPPVDVIQMLPLLPDRMSKPLLDALAKPVRNLDSFNFFSPRMQLREA
jgi:hypothetical protein